MIRFDDIRETLLQFSEPLEACKALTEKANLAGGHDNITVIVVKFDGKSLRDPSDAEPLKYRKYSLPEEPAELTSPARRLPSLTPAPAPTGPSPLPASSDPSVAGANNASWQEPGGGPHY